MPGCIISSLTLSDTACRCLTTDMKSHAKEGMVLLPAFSNRWDRKVIFRIYSPFSVMQNKALMSTFLDSKGEVEPATGNVCKLKSRHQPVQWLSPKNERLKNSDLLCPSALNSLTDDWKHDTSTYLLIVALGEAWGYVLLMTKITFCITAAQWRMASLSY